ncbi:MAG TPA: SCP2 sterol-binding domain-containing protein [Gammaproteobacteria bacterium]
MDNTIAEAGGLTGLLEQAVNAAISLDPEFPPKLSMFAGKCLEVHVLGLEYRLYVTVDGERLKLSKTPRENIDVTVRGAPLALLKLMAAGNPAALLQRGEVTMQGDVDLGRKFKAVLGELDIDWEELLAQRIGDIAAHKLGNLTRDFLGWRRHAHASFAASLGEFLQEEVQHTPARIEVENFMADVDDLREATDRLEARIGLLMKRKAPSRNGPSNNDRDNP